MTLLGHAPKMSEEFGARPYSSQAACMMEVDQADCHEHMILTLKGEVLYPESFKYPEVECQLYADPRLSQDIEPPKGIGSPSWMVLLTSPIVLPTPHARSPGRLATSQTLGHTAFSTPHRNS